MPSYFFSDVHLGLGDRERERGKEDSLLAFLRTILHDAANVFVVGDLFDFWFEYRTVVPRGFHRTLAALSAFTEKGIPVHYIAGNHDFWMGDFFRTELGMKVFRDPVDVTLDGKRIHIHHGDGLAENDTGYRLIKPVLRNRVNIALYRWLHPDIGVPLARGSSRASRAYTSNKDYGEGAGMLRYAERMIAQGADIVVMGHTHRPSLLPLGRGVYVNLGDWITNNSYGVMSDGCMTLYTWNGKPELIDGRAK